jgi:hypothetical protein
MGLIISILGGIAAISAVGWVVWRWNARLREEEERRREESESAEHRLSEHERTQRGL